MKACTIALVAAALVLSAVSPRAQSGAAPQRPVFRTATELVLVNVVVRDKTGAVVRGLTRGDFTVTEDDKAQTITSFDFEELDRGDASPEPAGRVLETRPAPARPPAAPAETVVAPPTVDMHSRRLIVLFFDLSSMQPEEIERAVRAAHDYVDLRLSPSDSIAVASFSTSLRVDQDFTSDKALLDNAVDAFSSAGGQGFEEGTTGDAEGTPDNGAAFTPDDTEFNIFNTDRRLDALQTLADALSGIEQKKSVIYFSSGMSQSGSDNQVELRRTVDRANRANVSIYAADMRGLLAAVPGGEASQASTRGVSAFSGAAVSSQFSRIASTQDTLTTMAGGHRRARVLRFQQLRRSVPARGRRYVGVLRARVLEHQPLARRPVPPHQGAPDEDRPTSSSNTGPDTTRPGTSRTRRATIGNSSSRIS